MKFELDIQHLHDFLAPFNNLLRNKNQRKSSHVYAQGLIRESERKSMQPIAQSINDYPYDLLHHFISQAEFDDRLLLNEVVRQGDDLAGGTGSVLILDDTTLLKSGKDSVGVAPQWSGSAGKSANCQSLVTTTLARDGNPVPFELHLYFPKAWTDDMERMKKAGVPGEYHGNRTNIAIGIKELDRILASVVTFDSFLADSVFGKSLDFRNDLDRHGLTWTVGIANKQGVYDANVECALPSHSGCGRRPTEKISDRKPVHARDFFTRGKGWKSKQWKPNNPKAMKATFKVARIRMAEESRLTSPEPASSTPCMKKNCGSSVNTGGMARGNSMFPTARRMPTLTR